MRRFWSELNMGHRLALLTPQCLTGILIGLLLALAPPESRAQEPTAEAPRSDYVHTYARTGEPTETVYVWGAVATPGVWEVEPGTGLMELFSVVQPTGFGTDPPGTDRKIRLRIHRTQNGETIVAHEMELQDLLDRRPAARPSLQPHDVIEVRTIETRTFGLRTIGSVVGTLSSVALLVIRVLEF
ncbi:MAG: hypothetical protein GVY25_08315 [Bacteroidetes bacterium]|jgi:hypothetical protein|nr:hypothetical protein [Bacteroidota bacterium]